MEYDMKLRLREMMAARLDDAIGDMHSRITTDPMAQLVRSLCETSLWLIRDWPGQKIDNLDSVRASRSDTLGRLRQLLRTRPPKHSELDSLILLLSDAMLTISEQWPGGESDKPLANPVTASPLLQILQQRPQNLQPTASSSTVTSATVSSSVHIPPVYGGQGAACKPPAPKLPKMAAKPWTVDGYQQPSTSQCHIQSNSFPPPAQRPVWKSPREMPQASNAGSPSALWTFYKKTASETGMMLAKCTVCSRMIPRHNHGTTGMKNHLKVHHPAEFATLGMDSSASSETSQSSPTGESTVPKKKEEKKEKAPANVSAIIAALNGEALPDMSNNSHLFNSDLVKEEEMDLDETLNQSLTSTNDNYDEPSSSRTITTAEALRPLRGGSDIWSYFTKEDVDGDKHGVCNLCDWSRKIYNHGTNTMWSHLRRAHPQEYAILKPYEYNPAVHGQVQQWAQVIGAIAPASLVLPRPPEELPNEEEGEE